MSYKRHDVPHGIMFHHFHDDVKHPKSQGSISAGEFSALLEFIGINRIISPEEWLEKLEKKQLGSDDLCLTFDDALLNQVDVALPVLERYNFKAFWFVYSGVFEGKLENLEIYRFFRTKYFDTIDDFYNVFFKKVFDSGFAENVNPEEEAQDQKEKQKLYPFQSGNDNRFRFFRDRALGREKYEKIMDSLLKEYNLQKADLAKNLWMRNEDLLNLSKNEHNVGLHSYSHPTVLVSLSASEQYKEYKKNSTHIARITGIAPVAMAHPCNSYNDETLAILHTLGIRCGFRSNMSVSREGDTLNLSDLEIAREDHANILMQFSF